MKAEGLSVHTLNENRLRRQWRSRYSRREDLEAAWARIDELNEQLVEARTELAMLKGEEPRLWGAA